VATSGVTHTGIFGRIVRGIHGTAASLFAAKQANRLQHPEGSLRLVAPGDLAAEPDTPGLQS
jgi:hypothetical protein